MSTRFSNIDYGAFNGLAGETSGDAREADISVLIVQALVILSGLGLLLSLVAGLTFGLDFPPNLF